MKNLPFLILFIVLIILICFIPVASNKAQNNVFRKDYILNIMYKANNYQINKNENKISRNWKQATYYTGVMAFYNASGDNKILEQSINWAERNDWKVGNEMFFPANRLTCTQTYLQIFLEKRDSAMINNSKDYMEAEVMITEPAYLRGWYYVDALYVGIPPFIMMSVATGQEKYAEHGNRVFWEIADQLYDNDENLFYRDSEARFNEKSKNSKKVLWSRGNGWAMASVPRILTYLNEDHPSYKRYIELFQKMAASLVKCQGEDGLWRTNLADYDEYPMPESSGTAFFIYAMAWGMNNNILEKSVFEPVVKKAWKGLCEVLDEEGKVCWGQTEARKPGKVKMEDSDEFVTGAFLIAGSEMLRLVENQKQE